MKTVKNFEDKFFANYLVKTHNDSWSDKPILSDTNLQP